MTPIKKDWENFRTFMVSQGAPSKQLWAMEISFYAGVTSLYEALILAGDENDEGDTVRQLLEDLEVDILNYKQALEKATPERKNKATNP